MFTFEEWRDIMQRRKSSELSYQIATFFMKSYRNKTQNTQLKIHLGTVTELFLRLVFRMKNQSTLLFRESGEAGPCKFKTPELLTILDKDAELSLETLLKVSFM